METHHSKNDWKGIVFSIVLSAFSLAYAAGIQAQKIRTLEDEIRIQRVQLENIPAILNELVNINRRLQEILVTLEKLPRRE